MLAHRLLFNMTEHEDIKKSIRGDGEAYARLIRRHQDSIARRMWRFTHDPRELEELVHDVFVEAYYSLSGWRGQADFSHWLNRIATRVGYKHWKRRKPDTQDLSPDIYVAAKSNEPLHAAEILDAALEKMKPAERLVLTLLYVDGLSVADAAHAAGMSQISIRVQAHRARKKLKQVFERMGFKQ